MDGEKSNPLGQTDISVPKDSSEIETRKDNYLGLNPQEAEAIKQFTARGSITVNLLFNTDIASIIPRLQYWRADENIEEFLDITAVNNAVYLYSALLKAYDYHQSETDPQDHPSRIYRGSTGNHHSDGFKSFT